jgi:hypothetical protein
MITSILVIIGFGALAQFAIAYYRTLLMAYGKVEVSDTAYAFAGIESRKVDHGDFDLLLRLVQMAPDPEDDSAEILIVQFYCPVMRTLRWLTGPLSPRLSRLAECELASCAHFAAVTLDRRLPPLSEDPRRS